jgi:hypothetical protein
VTFLLCIGCRELLIFAEDAEESPEMRRRTARTAQRAKKEKPAVSADGLLFNSARSWDLPHLEGGLGGVQKDLAH